MGGRADYDKNIVVNNILKAINLGKDIYCTLKLKNSDLAKIRRLCKVKNVKFLYYNNYFSKNKNINQIKQPQIPVIFICELFQNLNTYNLLIKLYQYFEFKNYHVSAIGEKHYSKLFNINPIPNFIFDPGIIEE